LAAKIVKAGIGKEVFGDLIMVWKNGKLEKWKVGKMESWKN